MDPSIGRASACRHNCPSFRSQLVDPLAGCDWLSRLRVRTPRRPVACRLVVFVRNRSFDDQDERLKLAFSRQMEGRQKLVSILNGKERVMEIDFGNPWQSTPNQIFDTRLGRGSHGDSVAIAPKPGSHPKNIEFSDRTAGSACDRWVRHCERSLEYTRLVPRCERQGIQAAASTARCRTCSSPPTFSANLRIVYRILLPSCGSKTRRPSRHLPVTMQRPSRPTGCLQTGTGSRSGSPKTSLSASIG